MGTIIEHKYLTNDMLTCGLIIYCKNMLKAEDTAISFNKILAEKLISLSVLNRSRKLEQCFVDALYSLPNDPIIKDIDVMFNPQYEVDVMKILISAYKKKHYSLIWSGSYYDGKLIYGEEKYPDYKIYNISCYDIICVI